jgi:alpha-L-rhamnosidase
MEFRFVNIVFATPPPASWGLRAWRVQYPWVANDTAFDSSNATLNAVWELSRYTLEAGVLDTYTDSNTRERRPYEADGLVVASARGWVQRDFAWARHSHSYVFTYPTWPVEWQQMSALLAYADYWATAEADLGAAYLPLLANNTRWADRDATGLLNCSAITPSGCNSRPGTGHHIIDWFPGPSGQMFKFSTHLSVNQAFAVRGLELLSTLAGQSKQADAAAALARKAATLRAAMMARMWDGNATGRFCDGICSEVAWHSGVTTSAWTLWLNLVPPQSVPAVWQQVADWGLEGFGDYGAHVYLSALNAYAGDDGSATLNALT